MPRYYKKKSNREFDPDALKQAVVDVMQSNMSIRRSAQKNHVTKSRLCNYLKKVQEKGFGNVEFNPNFRKAQIFTAAMENALQDYLLKCSAMFYGLTPKLVRRLAYEYGLKNSLTIPTKWVEDKIATEDWFSGFMHRHPRLSVRKPEATSLARMTSFNKTTVKVFQDKLELLMSRHSFAPEQIFNLDETGVTTVQRVQKIVGKKGEHQIGQVTSRERGELVTQVGIICASGNAIPPVWIFPRHRFDSSRMMKGITDKGPLGLVYPSGWMTCENFLKVLQHFVKHVRCSRENKVLLIMDNHESHLSLDAVDFCRANGIVILTLPPHTSNKLQPLDRTVFGPFKTFFNQAADAWMISHPGETLTIYDLPLMCLQSWDRAATPVNIKSGFRYTGIVPFDRNVFSDEDFLSSAVTDRPLAVNEDIEAATSVAVDIPQCTNEPPKERPNTPDNSHQPSTSGISFLKKISDEITDLSLRKFEKKTFLSPEEIKPFPKAAARKEKSNRGRKRGRCMIATDTPEKLLEEKKRLKESKMSAKKIKEAKRKVLQEESSGEETEEIVLDDLSSDDDLCYDTDEETAPENVPKGGYIIAKVFGKASVRKYVAVVIEKHSEGYEVRFLKRNIPSNRFCFLDESPAVVTFSEVVMVLPDPVKDSRPRFKDIIYFNVDLTEHSLQ